jgi:hypothetical protein
MKEEGGRRKEESSDLPFVSNLKSQISNLKSLLLPPSSFLLPPFFLPSRRYDRAID